MTDEKVLLVEGNDDVHSIIHVLKKRGAFSEGEVKFFDSQGWDKLLESIPVRIKSSAHNVIGIVADSDTVIGARWRDISSALAPFGFGVLPVSPPANGLLVQNADGLRVGVWLMPNNIDNGALEDFLLSLVDPADATLLKARNVVASLSATERKFGPTGSMKAIAHTYLSWQDAPGRPLGMAVNFNYFDGRAAAAAAFESWFIGLVR